MINRSSSYAVMGGDVVQMEKTRCALQEHHVNVAIRLADHLDDGDWNYDVVHIFNIQTEEESWRALVAARKHGRPVALSPIYWDPLPDWFNHAAMHRRVWCFIRGAVGNKLGLQIYSMWQRARYPQSATWQIQRRLLQSVDIILPNSNIETKQIRSDFQLLPHVPSEQIVPSGIDQALYDPRPAPADWLRVRVGSDRFVLQVGRISPEKNCLGLIDALWDVPVPIVFVGQASAHDPGYAQLCRERGKLRGKVHFLGTIPYEGLPEIYAAATVHALPSWRETPGLVSLEAAAAGCHVVTTSVGSAREYFGDIAWYCNPADKASIKRAVEKALCAPPSEELRMHVLRNFTWQEAAKKTLIAYQTIVEKTESKHND